jgi:hypothetical protein
MELSKEQVQKILDNAPKGADKRKVLDSLMAKGVTIQGIDPKIQQQAVQMKQVAQQVQGNQFDEAAKPQGFLEKARNLATGIFGGGKLAEGAGMSIAAPSLQSNLGEAQQEGSDIALELTKRIGDKKARGEDTSRLESALSSLQISDVATQDVQQDFTEALPTNKEVIGSSLRLGGTLAGGSIAKAFTPATKATGVLQGIGQGAKVGALTGATEGAIQGAGIGLERNQDAGGVIGSALGGAALGGVTGGIVGGAIGGVTGQMNKTQALNAQKEALLKSKPDSTVAKYTLDGQGKVATDPVAQEAIKQGVSESTVATIKGSSVADKQKALKALDILEKGKVDEKYRALNRPSDVIGESAMERFKVVAQKNVEAGKQLDTVAQSLKGQKLNPTPAVQSFIDDLEGLGVRIKDGKAIYKGSDIEGLKAPQRIIDSVIKRMSEVSDDAFELHKLKRYIDENVAYGKAGEGLSGRAEGIVKGLRANIDGLLDESFDTYNQVNTQYAKTRGVLDNFSDIAGTRFDPKSPNANAKIGTLARRILSNAQSRTDVINALDDLQSVAIEYGGKFDDDIVTQTVFVNELEKLFGTQAPTSLAGEVTKGVDKARGVIGKMKSSQGLFDMAMQVGAEGIEKARNINEEALIQSIRRMLSS